MSVQNIRYQSNTNLFNQINNTPSAQVNSKVESFEPENSNKEKGKKPQSALYAGAGIAVVLLGLLSLCNKKIGKFMKNLFGTFENKLEKNKITAISLPDNKPIVVEEVDTRFISPYSKLRLKPEIVDVPFEELPGSNCKQLIKL